jgi:hypothetical protein
VVNLLFNFGKELIWGLRKDLKNDWKSYGDID